MDVDVSLSRAKIVVWLMEFCDVDTIDGVTIEPFKREGRRKPTLADELNDPYRGAVKIGFQFHGKKRYVVFTTGFAEQFKDGK